MPKRKRKKLRSSWPRRILAAIAIPLACYLGLAALGAIVPLNPSWEEPEEGTTVYLVDNGVHLDIAFPVAAEGLDWRPNFPADHLAEPLWASASHVMIGAGDLGIYTTAEDWGDLRPGVAVNALVDGERVMHVQYVEDPARFAVAEIRLRPAEYRRLYQAVRSSFDLDDDGQPQLLADVDGYFPSDAFYAGQGPFSAVQTCNQWVASRLRIAGVETSLWVPFSKGLPWRFREPGED
ncbi:TIGR02117 family protein [Sphingomicrobium sediminis]|uniref:TIGR02117 family protein n=1 Tax=Sphingomicrobium sediminis TaxID=2950949 RepID=A0A9X2ELL5_9SPHN|nr:TIGR02117 family protein [Sphingomicrobium sediminis]MCM8557734.1 TIGR02117 family protein [Sphingomicrobium sediminis]